MFYHKLNFIVRDANKKYWSFWAHRLALDYSLSSFFIFFFIHVAVSGIFALCVSTLLSTLKTAFDLCVIISIVLERFMKIMTGSCAHWYSDMSSLLVTWTICHFTKPLSIIQSNYNSFSDYAIFTRLFFDSLWQARVRLFCGSIFFFITDKAIS